MYIDFDGMQTKELPNFKGGEKTFRADMFDDGDTKIMRGRLESGASIGLHTHEGNCEIIYILSGNGKVKYDDTEEKLSAGSCHYCPNGHSHSLIDAEKIYDNGTHALNGVSFTVDDGEFAFLVGPSGSGKSTIIKLLTGEVVPTSGRVMVNGFSMSRISERQIPYMRRTIGVIFQDFRLIANKTVYDNLALAMRAVGASPKALRERIPYVLELVGLADKENRYPDELSGGEQQRVAIARALVNNPSTIVADEPTGNLDPARSLEIMTLLERINALGTTVIVVTHERGLVNRFNKRIILLHEGRVIGDGMGSYEV